MALNVGPVSIGGRLPDCPDCGAQMQGVQGARGIVFRCPWVTEARWQLAKAAGVTVASCDKPLDGDREPDGIDPYRD